jgi:hypothetical protein
MKIILDTKDIQKLLDTHVRDQLCVNDPYTLILKLDTELSIDMSKVLLVIDVPTT